MVVCGWLYSPRSLYSARWVKRTETVSGAGKVHCRKWISAGVVVVVVLFGFVVGDQGFSVQELVEEAEKIV